MFVSVPSDGSGCSDFVEVSELAGSYQETYSRAKTRALVNAYANNNAPDIVRASVADVTVLRQHNFRSIVTRFKVKPITESPTTQTPSAPTMPSAAPTPAQIDKAIP